MVNELVSAIITTHNRIGLLPKAIDSVLSQTYPNIECIVVSDASTDGTDEYCEKRDDIKFVKISKKDSKGGNYARNCGINAAKGEYVAFLDDDDYWLPEKIEKQVLLQKKMNCSVVHCGRIVDFVKSGESICQEAWLPNDLDAGDMSRRILTTICTTTSCMMVRRKDLIDVGCFDENLKFWQEYELTIRLAQIGNFYFVREPLCVYRIDQKDKNRLTNKYYEWKKAVEYIKRKHKVLFEQLTLVEKIKAKHLVFMDARQRCNSEGLFIHRCYYAFLFRVTRLLLFLLEKK